MATISDLYVLNYITHSENRTGVVIAQGVRVLARSGIRYEHSTRSTLTKVGEDGATRHGAQGKPRSNGEPAPPLDVFVPEVRIKGGPFPVGLVGSYCKTLQTLVGDKAVQVMIPKLRPSGASFATAKKVVLEPMP